MQHEKIPIRGMSCDHCVMSVRKALTSMSGVLVDSVQIGSADIRYDDTKISRAEIVRAIENVGYEVSGE